MMQLQHPCHDSLVPVAVAVLGMGMKCLLKSIARTKKTQNSKTEADKHKQVAPPLLITCVPEITLHIVKFSQFPGRAQWSVHLYRFIEFRVVNLVSLSIFIVSNDRVESVTPQNFHIQITGSRLCSLTG